MLRFVRGLIAVALCLSLVRAALPVKPAMVCLAVDGHILDFCPEGGHREANHPVPHQCCRPVVSSQARTSPCLVSHGVRCGFVSVSKNLPAATKSVAAVSVEMPLWAAPTLRLEAAAEPFYDRESRYPDYHDPPPAVPYAPDSSRAPPLA